MPPDSEPDRSIKRLHSPLLSRFTPPRKKQIPIGLQKAISGGEAVQTELMRLLENEQCFGRKAESKMIGFA